jgi:muramidase (phage lysozyme)
MTMPSPITDPNARKWLDAIAYAEGTDRNLTGDNGYNVIFGGGTFKDLSRHPDRVISGGGYSSAAAGRYQFMPDTWKGTAAKLGLKDFGPAAQDLAAVQLMKQRGIDPYSAPFNPQNIAKLAPEWASLPTLAGKSYYGQPVVSFEKIQKAVETPRYNFPRQGEVSRFAGGQTTSEVPGQFKLPDFNLNGRIEQALVGNILNSAMSPAGNDQSLYNAVALNDAAAALDESDDPIDQLKAEEYKSKAMSAMLSSSPAGLNPTDILNTVAKLKQQEAGYNENASQLEAFINSVRGSQSTPQAVQSAQIAAKPTQGVAYTGVSITNPNDTGGKGMDFVIEGGKRGAKFVSPFQAEVLKVTKDPREFNLEKGATARGYGNNVELRFKTPEGKVVDTLVAHFDQLNPNIKPGDIVNPGTYLGTQGRTGSTTGPHISMDFFNPGSTSADAEVMKIKDFIRDRIGKGLPVFG